MNKKIVIGGILVFFCLVLIIFQQNSNVYTETELSNVLGLPDSPLNASYKIEEEEIRLQDGNYASETFQVSVSKGPYYGDINGDGKEDALLLLTVLENNENYFYLALALQDEDGFLGLEATKLAQNKEPYDLKITDQYITVLHDSSMSPQSSFEEEYFSLTGLQLRRIPLSGEDTIYKGYYVYGHESRVFLSCNSEEEFWISPESASRAALEAIYIERTRDSEPYTQVYVVVAGHTLDAPQDGFGADFAQAMFVESIISVPLHGECPLPLEGEMAENKDHTSPQ